MICAFICTYLSELLTHLNSVHRNDSEFFRKCGLPDCSSNKEYTLVKHVRSKHSSLISCTYDSVFPTVEDTEDNSAGEI